MNLNDVIGVGDKTLTLLQKLNLLTIEDLITYYPYRYNVYKLSELNNSGEVLVVSGIIEGEPKVNYIKRNLNRLSFRFNVNGIITNVSIFNRDRKSVV